MLHDSKWRLRRVKLAKQETTAYVLVVLVASLVLFNVGRQVRVHHADVGVVEAEANRHSSLISL